MQTHVTFISTYVVLEWRYRHHYLNKSTHCVENRSGWSSVKSFARNIEIVGPWPRRRSDSDAIGPYSDSRSTSRIRVFRSAVSDMRHNRLQLRRNSNPVLGTISHPVQPRGLVSPWNLRTSPIEFGHLVSYEYLNQTKCPLDYFYDEYKCY